jgi:hypothetical protein
MQITDPSFIDPRIDSRSISFENPTGRRGGGGTVAGGRKGSPFYVFEPGERLVVADIAGTGTVRRMWLALDAWAPTTMRALRCEVFYEDLTSPSVSVPVLDFFGLPHGRFAEFYSAIASANEGRGLNSYAPMPFERSIRIEFVNESDRTVLVFAQIDYTLEPHRDREPSYLHASFRRENPTTLRRDFVITDGLNGPGRFLGCVVGVRTIDDPGDWYCEGEVKIFRDGDREHPTICGTGVDDYVGSAWGLGRHWAPYAGVPLDLRPRVDESEGADQRADSWLAGFYRWHLLDPVMFAEELTVTIQQIGAGRVFRAGQEDAEAAYRAQRTPAGPGWVDVPLTSESLGFSTVERVDDYCATAFVYCREPQAVTLYDLAAATADVGWTSTEAGEAGFGDDDRARYYARIRDVQGAQLRRSVGRDGISRLRD